MDQLYRLLQSLLPQHSLSRVVHRFTRIRVRWFKNLAIRLFVRSFGVNLREAVRDTPEEYDSFNDFFTRDLRPGQRPLAPRADALLCPVDGRVSQAGRIADGRLLQAKGRDYSLAALLGDRAQADLFRDGSFATLYLAPDNYHRIHMPLAGTLVGMRLVPGRLFSVDERSARAIPELFARNERVVTLFDAAHGPMALILVGALFVGSIETVWHGEVTPGQGRGPREWGYPERETTLARGAEMGRFNMGSTVIALFGAGMVHWADDLIPGRAVRMGEPIGRVCQDETGTDSSASDAT